MAGDQTPRDRPNAGSLAVSLRILRRPKAVEDIETHAAYLAADNLDVALRFLDDARQTIEQIAEFPSSGAPFPSRNSDLAKMRTKLMSNFPNYVIFYIEHEDSVEVVRILRGGQDMEEEIGRA